MKYISIKLLVAGIFLTVAGILPFTARALTVSPVKIEIIGDPGATVKSEFQLFNEEGGTRTFYSSFANFEAQGESGAPSFVAAKEGLATWFNAPAEIKLKSKEQKTVPFSIAIPKNADPGGHFAAIFWGTTPPSGMSESQVSVGAKVGILVLLKVSGEIKEGGGILDFSTLNNQKTWSVLPVSFVYRFQNSGNDRVKPVGEVTIKNIFGQTVVTLSANEKEGNVLPASIRKFEVVWQGTPKKTDPALADDSVKRANHDQTGFFQMAKNEWNNFALGFYNADLDLKFGDKEGKANFSFFVIPWQLLILLAVILIIMILGFTKGIKAYNQWIIKKAREGRI